MKLGTIGGEHEESRGFHIDDRVRGVLVVLAGGTIMVALAFGAMLMLTSPDGWVMKVANQAVMTAQEGTLASYDPSDAQ
jgi:hypothetical protein